MDGVLEGAAVLCACKLACSLLFLPSLADSYSAVSFCCCCLLVFTDFLVTAFLSCLCIFDSWLTDLTPSGDFIALRFLLFLSQTYGAVLLLTAPLIAVETVIRLLWPCVVVPLRTARRTAGSDGQCCDGKEEEEEDSSGSDEDIRSHVVGYLCCLSVWVIVALNVRGQWKLEEVWAAACLHTNSSLVRCLPSLFSPIPSGINLCWSMGFFLLLLLLTTSSTGLQRRRQGHSLMFRVFNKGDCHCQELIPESSAPLKPVKPGMLVSEPAQHVDPEKTESSCTVHTAWNSWQMLTCNHGDFVLISPMCLSGKKGRQEQEMAGRDVSVAFITEENVDSQCRSWCGWRQWGFPSLGVNVMIGLVCVLSIFALPLNLSVNVVLVRTIETLLELCIKSVLSSNIAANTRDTSTSGDETLI
ncbi:uncharacterized protein LOC120746757 isoform X3 [Simochromis diagramma]|nr:uncharacterized protein LOC120746757 isoform X3 [Simochromis diagramma]